MRKYLGIAVTLAAIVSLVFIPGASAQTPSVFWTDTPEYDQVKVAQVPLPWQFWAYLINADGTVTIIDRIRISPTWETPPIEPPGPPGEGPILVRRWSAVAPNAIPLEDLVWEFRNSEPLPGPPPLPGVDWEPVGEDPTPVTAGQDLTLEIPVLDPAAGAVLVAYEVLRDKGGVLVPEGHFLNEAVLEPPSNGAALQQAGSPIVEVRVNFDIHNDTIFDVTNFELDFQGLEFSGDDITGAIGFVAAQTLPDGTVVSGAPWGANDQNPLIVRPITFTMADGTTINGTEVKWVEPCNPLKLSDWLHIGLSFTLPEWIDSVNATVQGYWTTIPFPAKAWCVETENPHGKTVPPAGETTLPGPKGGQNEDGFYQLFAEYACPDTTLPPLDIFVTWKGADSTDPIFGPFASSERVKITEAPGAPPSSKDIGSSEGQAGAVKAHITIPSDAIIYATDAAGNTSLCAECLVPPPPK